MSSSPFLPSNPSRPRRASKEAGHLERKPTHYSNASVSLSLFSPPPIPRPHFHSLPLAADTDPAGALTTGPGMRSPAADPENIQRELSSWIKIRPEVSGERESKKTRV